MTEKKYTEEELKQYADMEAVLRLHGMKVGEPITQHQVDAVQHFFGHILDKVKPVSTTIHFENGEPSHTTGHDLGISTSVDGEEPKVLEHR